MPSLAPTSLGALAGATRAGERPTRNKCIAFPSVSTLPSATANEAPPVERAVDKTSPTVARPSRDGPRAPAARANAAIANAGPQNSGASLVKLHAATSWRANKTPANPRGAQRVVQNHDGSPPALGNLARCRRPRGISTGCAPSREARGPIPRERKAESHASITERGLTSQGRGRPRA